MKTDVIAQFLHFRYVSYFIKTTFSLNRLVRITYFSCYLYLLFVCSPRTKHTQIPGLKINPSGPVKSQARSKSFMLDRKVGMEKTREELNENIEIDLHFRLLESVATTEFKRN